MTKQLLKIHGKWYDVKNFKHPGGPIAIGLGYGRDATALFEGHHPLSSRAQLKAILAKYEVPQSEVTKRKLKTFEEKAGEKNPEVFQWGEGGIDRELSPFEKEVKEEVYNYFKTESKKKGISVMQATKATTWRWIEMITFLILTLITIPFMVTGHWWTLIVTPILVWLLAANTTHDSMHFSISSDWRINAMASFTAPFTSSPLMWYHQHVIGHHAYPNVSRKDPDIAHAPAIMRVHESINWKKAHTWQLITVAVVWTLGATLYMTLVPLKTLMKGTFNRAVFVMNLSKFRLTRHLIGRVLCALALWSWPWFVFPVWQAIIWCTVPMFIHSFCFMGSTQLNHLTPFNAKSADLTNYYKHQVLTSHSFAPYSYLTFLATGGLNLQIEHHLFPTVNHCHLPQLHFIVKTVCAKHNVAYHESESFFSALKKYIVHIREMAVRPQNKKME